jgi:uncharacterized OB-fold protein
MADMLTKAPPAALFKLVTDQWTEPFWTAAASHQLRVSRCADCGRFRMPPSPFCAGCQSQRIEWVTLNGRGSIYSYTIISTPIIAEAVDSVPYVPAVIEVDGAPGVRLISCVVGARLSDIRIGSTVEVFWDDLSDGVTVPRFRLSQSSQT